MKTAMSRYDLGLRGRLFTAFRVVAAFTVLASSSAIISYDRLGRSLGAIADKKVLSSAQSLSGESNRLKLEVAKFLNSVRAA
ncbi:MAG: hypothetical protein ACXWKP_20390 [Bradyrhizobium sp.]